MNQDSQPGCRLGPYSCPSSFLHRFVIGAGIDSSDQVLFVTAGTGIIATETEEKEITVGDIVHITADEKHWHGATPHADFSHMALTAKGSTTTQVEP
jgi:hypothetical protein